MDFTAHPSLKPTAIKEQEEKMVADEVVQLTTKSSSQNADANKLFEVIETYLDKNIAPPLSVPDNSLNPHQLCDSNLQNGKDHLKKCRRRDVYTLEDGQTLLEFICKNNLHEYYSGLKCWKKGEALGLLGGRSALSMWQHFRKKVYPNRDSDYSCSRLDMEKFAISEWLKWKRKRRTLVPECVLRDIHL